jgi:type II secretory pathway component GspD/PulD (secretin)
VPLLSSIPVLGHIFTYHYNRTIRDAVLITLTPTIMQNTDMLEQVSKRSMEEVMKNDHFTQQALKQSGKAPAKGKEPEKK